MLYEQLRFIAHDECLGFMLCFMAHFKVSGDLFLDFLVLVHWDYSLYLLTPSTS